MVSLLPISNLSARESSKNAARFVINDFSQFSSVTRIVEHLSWPSLEQRRMYSNTYAIQTDLSSC